MGPIRMVIVMLFHRDCLRAERHGNLHFPFGIIACVYLVDLQTATLAFLNFERFIRLTTGVRCDSTTPLGLVRSSV